MLTLDKIGKKLKSIRERLGFSQDFVAKELNINRQAIIAIESGRRKIDSFELFKLAELYGVDVFDIINESKVIMPNFQEAVMHLRKNDRLSDNERKALLDFDKIFHDYQFLMNL
jgi:transcriptional regulator with XRE-family HTH domain